MMTVTEPSPGSKKGQAGFRGASKEYRKLVKSIEEAGGGVRRPTGRGHPKVYYQGRFLLTLCNTPSDYRSRRNELARLRQAGLDI